MLIVVKPFRLLFFAFCLVSLGVVGGCHAQTPVPAGGELSPDTARRVEVLIRSKSNIPLEYEVKIGPREKSDVPGFDTITVLFSKQGKDSKPVQFLISKDLKTLAQFTKYDISKDPKELVSPANRPARGGPVTAPVLIVEFDDLECPYCAKMHAQIFPALLKRYKDQVRIVYRDFPLSEIHPWAMRAAIDTSCMAAQSGDGYWKLIDYMHAHASEFGGDEKSLQKAQATLDALTLDEGKRQQTDQTALKACIAKQDDSVVEASKKEATALGVDATPSLFINGEKLDGAVPMEYVYRAIDRALAAAGQTPPPPETAPASKTAAPTTPAVKPGN
jgi:protein-disulfide isomerase